MNETTPVEDMILEDMEPVEDECPVCLAKRVAQDSLPHLAASLRNVAEWASSPDCDDYEYVNKATGELLQAVRNTRAIIDELKRCDCDNSDETPDESVTYQVSAESQRDYEV